jgi:hypothetical protein
MGDPVTIGQEDRDTLVALMAYRYFVTGDLRIMRDCERGVDDRSVVAWFEDDLALMTDLGWLQRWWLIQLGLPESEKTEFELWLPPARLRAAIERALADAREASASGVTPPAGSPEDLFHRAEHVCESLLAQLDRTEASE